MSESRLTSPKTPAPLASRLSLQGKIALFRAAWVILACVVWVVYGRAMNSPFIFDDHASVNENRSIIRLWPLVGDLEHSGPLNPPRDNTTSGRPLVNLSLALNYHFGQLDPAGYHVFNLFVHLLSALLLMAIVRRTLRLEYFEGRFDQASGLLSLLVALLWAIHPLQTETVVYVTQRTELLVGFFYLATLYASLRYWSAPAQAARTTWLALSTLACLAGMACKEVMVTAPVVVLLFERTFISGSFRQALHKSWPLYLGLSLGWALLLALNYNGPRSGSAGFHQNVPAYAWWLTQSEVLWMYLKLFVWPWPLAIHYAMPYLTTVAAAWPWLLATVVLIVATLYLLWRHQPVGFVGAWVLVILSPTLVVPIVTEVAAERRMYLPLAALAALVVVGGYRLTQQMQQRLARDAGHWPVAVAGALALLLALALSIVSVRRLAVYHDNLTLWQDNAIHQPEDSLVHYNFGNELAKADRPQEAIEHYQQALRLKPDYAEADNNLGTALAKTGHLRSAIEHLQHALQLKPDYAEAHYNLGLAFAQAGQIEPAIQCYLRALHLQPDYPEAHNNLGNALFKSGQMREGIEHFQRASKYSPTMRKPTTTWLRR